MPVFPPAPNNANTYLPGTVVTPGTLLIEDIAKSYPMAVTFTDNDSNTYIPGMVVRLFVPEHYGMIQANNLQGEILEIDDVSFIFYLNIDSRNFDTFVIPTPGMNIFQPASMSPAGSRNLVFNNLATKKVAFQNLNNEGN